MSLSELEDYVHNLEPVAFTHQTPVFPVSKNNVLQFPQPGARDAEERKDYIPDYMPPLVSLQEGRCLSCLCIYASLSGCIQCFPQVYEFVFGRHHVQVVDQCTYIMCTNLLVSEAII